MCADAEVAMYEAPSDMSKANGLLAEALGVKSFPTLQVRYCQPSLLLSCNIAMQFDYLFCPHTTYRGCKICVG